MNFQPELINQKSLFNYRMKTLKVRAMKIIILGRLQSSADMSAIGQILHARVRVRTKQLIFVRVRRAQVDSICKASEKHQRDVICQTRL